MVTQFQYTNTVFETHTHIFPSFIFILCFPNFSSLNSFRRGAVVLISCGAIFFFVLSTAMAFVWLKRLWFFFRTVHTYTIIWMALTLANKFHMRKICCRFLFIFSSRHFLWLCVWCYISLEWMAHFFAAHIEYVAHIFGATSFNVCHYHS